MVEEHGTEFLIIDYLQLIQSKAMRFDREKEITEISRGLKILSKDLNIHTMCLSQLNRKCELREDKRPLLSDLRESGSIEQDADMVIFIYRDDYYNEETKNKNIAECQIAKNRHGTVGKIYLKWIPDLVKFGNLTEDEKRIIKS